MTQLSKGQMLTRRKYLFYSAGIALLYPILHFVGFKVPQKPIYIPIHNKLPSSGYITTKDFVLFDRNKKYWALSRRCTHLGCKLTYLEEKDILECPCHQSQFNAQTGAVLHGPAKKPLKFLPVDKREGDPQYVVTA
jgi:cytochrome b6-f complex iron-sulfur subunit